MSELLYALALLACPLVMGAMMWMMMRGQQPATQATGVNQAKLAHLRAEIDQLRAERPERGERPEQVSGRAQRAGADR